MPTIPVYSGPRGGHVFLCMVARSVERGMRRRKASDSTPRYFRLGRLEAITEPLGRCRDGLQIAYFSVLYWP